MSHFDGTSWSPVEELDFFLDGPYLGERIWELAPNDVWIANEFSHQYGFNGYWHFDGVTWTGEAIHEDDPRHLHVPELQPRRASSSARTTAGWSTCNGTWLRNTR